MTNMLTTLDTGPAALALSRVEEARALLAETLSAEFVLEFRSVAMAAEFYERQRKGAGGAHADAWAIRQEADRRLGELCKLMPRDAGGRPRKGEQPDKDRGQVSKAAELRRLGITRGEAARLEKVAAIPVDDFRSQVDRGREQIKTRGKAPKIGSISNATDYDGDAYGTPEKYITSVRKVLGSIELDPFSNAMAQNIVRALRFFTKDDSGIAVSWATVLGPLRTVYWNPPYSRGLIDQCVAKFLHEYRDLRSVRASIALVNSSTETGWYQRLIGACTLMCVLDHRIAFLIGDKPIPDNRYAQTIFYFGPDPGAFYLEFKQYGQVLAPVRDACVLPSPATGAA